MKKQIPLLILVVSMLFLACSGSSDEATPPLDKNTGMSYFHLVKGSFREYEVFDIRYFAVGISDTSQYQLREVVMDTFTDNSGELVFLIHQFRRNSSEGEWELNRVKTAWIDSLNGRAVETENNVSEVKMVFPAGLGRTWDGNLFNSSDDEDTYEIVQFEVPFSVPGQNDPVEAMFIEQNNDEDSVTFRDVRIEVYADSIGRVYVEKDTLEYCTGGECSNLDTLLIQSGRYLEEKITAFGMVEEDN